MLRIGTCSTQSAKTLPLHSPYFTPLGPLYFRPVNLNAFRMSTKIPKACEPCRMRKKRCNRIHPCHNPDCQNSPQNCVYRPRARTRRSKRGNSEPVSQLPLLGSVHSVDGKST